METTRRGKQSMLSCPTEGRSSKHQRTSPYGLDYVTYVFVFPEMSHNDRCLSRRCFSKHRYKGLVRLQLLPGSLLLGLAFFDRVHAIYCFVIASLAFWATAITLDQMELLYVWKTLCDRKMALTLVLRFLHGRQAASV